MSDAAPLTRLAILLTVPDDSVPHLCAPPFVYAAMAAVMDTEVEVHFAARSVRLLLPGVAEGLFPGGGRERSVRDFMNDAHAAGARFYACRMATRQYAGEEAALIELCDGTRGAMEFVSRVLDPAWATMTF